jgi:autotransporter-associated beta strand protein
MNVVFQGPVDLAPNQTNKTITLAGNGNFTFRGPIVNSISGTNAGIVVTNSGYVSLEATNSYDGATLIQQGALIVATNGALPTNSAVTVSSGASLKFNKSSGGISVGALTAAGTLEQNLITITSSGAVDLTGSTLTVNETPTLTSYTLVSGSSMTGTPTLSPAISGYALRVSGNNLLLEKVVSDAYALYLSNNNLPADTAFDAIIDGVRVGLKYAFASANGMPQNNGEAAVPVITQLPSGNQQMTYTFDVKEDCLDVNYPSRTVTYQTSTDLVNWTTAQDVSPGTGAAPTGFLKKQAQVTGSDKLFVRINVTR